MAPGVVIGGYEVGALLGVGGMGEVYRARDTRLGREVAIKILPVAFAADGWRRARVEREARALASLNHPNIATLYGVEDTPTGQVLIMELVEGDTLADRLALAGRAPHGLPLREAVSIAQQMAAALEAAHEQGIVHGDLKPANVVVRPDGTVKVLDFGLAQTVNVQRSEPEGATAVATLTDVTAGTGPGTPAYMSPEQARGLRIDKRTDIWAFGCVLYELLSGHRPFGGDSSSEVVARILEREPDFDALPPETPAAIRRLLRRCLEKERQDRLRDIGDARLELTEALAPPPAVVATPRRPMHWRSGLAGVVAAAVITGAAAWIVMQGDSDPPPRVIRFSIPAQLGASFGGRVLAISPDGSRLAYLTSRGLVVRSRDRLNELLLLGVGNVRPQSPFFSPDGEWIAYSTDQALYKIPTTDGAAVPLADVGPGAIGSWGADGVVFADMRGLYRVSPEGGALETLRMPPLAVGEQVSHPEPLPGGRAVLFTVIPTPTLLIAHSGAPGERIDVLNLDTGTRKTIVRHGRRGRYLPTGHLVYVADGSLYAARFDINRLEVAGSPVQVVSDVANLEFTVADDGTLVYASGGGPGLRTLVWVDRQGREEALEAPPRPYLYPRLSPNGTHVALDVAGPPERNIWIWEPRRRALERFTVDPASNPLVAWSRDGKRIAFGSNRFGPTNLFVQAADSSGEPQRLLESDRIQMPITFAPDGRLLFSEDVPKRGRDIRALSLDGSGRVESIVHSPGHDATAEVSPGGRWIAFDSNESGQFEVYVRPYPDADPARWQVSVNGGRQPLWSRDGRELFYRDFAGHLMSVPVVLRPTFSAGPAVRILDGAAYLGSGAFMSARTYDLSVDGRRFLMLKPVASEAAGSLIVVVNWFEELKRLVPGR